MLCAVRVECGFPKLLFDIVYMHYDSDKCSTTEFIDKLIAIEDVSDSDSNCRASDCGEFNVDFTGDHTLLLDSFCESFGQAPCSQAPQK